MSDNWRQQAASIGKVFQPPSQDPPPFFFDDDDDDDDDDDEDEVATPLFPGNNNNFEEEEPEDDTAVEDDDDDDDDEDEEEEEPPRKRPKSLAFSYLQGQATHAHSDLSETARGLLQGLLREHHLLLESNHQESDTDVATALSMVAQEQQQSSQSEQLRVVNSSLSDFSIVSLTKHAKDTSDQWSYLASFLAVMDHELANSNNNEGVPAKVLIKQCCLAIAPQHVPAVLDAEEMAMAALEFLSSSTTSTTSGTFPQLPLIRPVKEENDIRRRNYVKAGNWTWAGLSSNPTSSGQLRALEDVFWNDATSYRFLRRGAFVPPSLSVVQTSDSKQSPEDVQAVMAANNELDQLMRKGGKHKVVATAPKKKATPANK